MELTGIKGLGAKRLAALSNAGVRDVPGLLFMLPKDYIDTTRPMPIADLREGERACVCGYIQGKPRLSRFRGLTSVTATLRDDSGRVPLVYYNQPWMQEKLDTEEELLLYGRVERGKDGRLRLSSPSIEKERALRPVYAALPGLPGAVMQSAVSQALSELDACCPETLPQCVRARHHLCELNFALRAAHRPRSREDLQIALRRLAFERALSYQTALLMLRGESERGVAIPATAELAEAFWRSLPFSPTNAQRRVLAEIVGDMVSERAMGRMVQGDVGSGKTAVAFGAMYIAAKCGFQSALMAPTEILARQHLESAKAMFAPLGVQCGLLLGGMRAKERREALQAIKTGAWQAVLGTHALISEGVEYQNLGLVITDEQHRFGVAQRKRLSQKAPETPNALVMSATPIPRSLALLMYGDLALSVIDELPPGRTPVRTRIVPESKREGLYQFIIAQAAAGYQTYIVCPLVEESDMLDAKSAQDMYAALSLGALSSLRLGLTFGAQPSQEKADVLEKFTKGELDVLIATTVVEVGVNVPRATCIVIENADHFGLSQLHQLRGRVGRGAKESWCFLLAEPNERLTTLCQTNDGFVVAQKDLEMRGPGELLGLRQHGAGALASADAFLLEEAHDCLRWLQEKAQKEAFAEVQKNARRLLDGLMEDVAMN